MRPVTGDARLERLAASRVFHETTNKQHVTCDGIVLALAAVLLMTSVMDVCGMMIQPDLFLCRTEDLTPADRDVLAAFGETRGVSETYLRPRLSAYPLVVRFFDQNGIAAFQLIERYDAPDQSFIYLGPLVSRSRAYLSLFEGLVGYLAATGRAFHCAAEFENEHVLAMLGRLLPTRSWPGLTPRPPRAKERRVLRQFAACVTHLTGFDETTLTSRMCEATAPTKPLGRYRLAVFGCNGTLGDRRALLAELEAGLADLAGPMAVCA